MDECQNVIAFNDLEVTDDATTTTTGHLNTTSDCMNMGQSESKKLAKRSAGGITQPETKGTAMSFGFKKKLLHSAGSGGASGKKANAKERERQRQAEADADAETAAAVAAAAVVIDGDNNGNTDAPAGRTTPRLTPPRKESNGGPYRSIRFGFRQSNVVRPASTGLHPSPQAASHNNDNASNNNPTGKPRSKSASNTTRSVTPNGTAQAMHGANKSLTPSPTPMQTAADRSPSSSSTKPLGPVGPSSLTPPPPPPSSSSDDSAADQTLRTAPHPKISGPVSTTVNISYQQQQQQQQQQPQPHHSRPIKALEMSQHSSGHTTTMDGTNKPPTGKQPQQPSQQQHQPQTVHPHHHLYTNDIIRPTPQQPTASSSSVSALVTKFTLHTSSLPQPQFPVSINLASTTPSPVDPMPPTHYPTVTHPTAYTSPTAAAAMDTKYAKQAANATRRYGAGGFRGPREISADSGIANMSGNQFCFSTSSTEHSSSFDSPPSSACAASGLSSARRPQSARPRNLEMVMSSRHKFDVRELDDSMSDESPLALLPTLPSSFGSGACGQQPASLSGLTRQLQQQQHHHNHNQRPSTAPGSGLHATNYRKASFASLLDVESIEEEKEFLDKSTTEKGTRSGALLGASAAAKEYSPSSKTSSPISSRASWCNAGESMAVKDCSSMSVSSCDSMHNRELVCRALSLDEQDDVDNCSSAVVISGDMLSSSISAATKSNLIYDAVPPLQYPIQNDARDTNTISKAEQILTVDIGRKFAQITASVDDMFLDDETSPNDSLVSSTDSDEIISKRNKKKINDAIKGMDFDDAVGGERESTSPLLLSPCSPTHASHSLSMSDEGRDFLIDDEIADQPALCFSKSHEIAASMQHLHSLTDTPTLRDDTPNTSHKSGRSKSRKCPADDGIGNEGTTNPPPLAVINSNSYAPQAKPRHSLLTRTESLDTMSSCESIASDDMMMDFDSSVDSIDRMCQSVHSGSTSALHSMDEAQLWSEWETHGGSGMMHEWSSLLRGPKPNCGRESVITQLPARATRLLNRSRVQHGPGSALKTTSHHGSDSPRSLDSFGRRTPSARSGGVNSSSSNHHNHLLTDASRESEHSSDDSGLFVLDKLTRNTMLQDVLSFKKQLLQLRSVLQQPEEECLTRTDTLNPFEISNGLFFGNTGTGMSTNTTDTDGPNSSSGDSTHNGDNLYNLLHAQSHEESKLELADLRRQVVYLQSQMDDKDRTIRYQQTLIEKLETEIDRTNGGAITPTIEQVDTTNSATQTERIRPISMGHDVSASTSESEEPPKTPLKATSPAQVKRQTFSRLTSPLHSTSSAAATTHSKLSPNSSPIATSKQPNRKAAATSCSPQIAASRAEFRTPGLIDPTVADGQPSSAKTSPYSSPRRIPRLLKGSTAQAHSLVTKTNNGNNNRQQPQQQPNSQPKSNGTIATDKQQHAVVDGTRNPYETQNHNNQAQHYQKLSTNGHHTSNHHRMHNNHIITNHANGIAENAELHAKIKLQHNNRADMLRSPVFCTPVCASDAEENDF